MECYSCYAITRFDFAVNTRIDVSGEKCITMCCRNRIGEIPSTDLTDNPRRNLEGFISMRHLAIVQGLAKNVKEQEFACKKCYLYMKKNWTFLTHINYVNLSVYPSPCQCRCFYCTVREFPYNHFDYFKKNSATLSKAYENLFDTLKLAKKLNLTLPQQTTWQVSSGEITIHPYKKEILDLVRGEKSFLLTNAFIFDESIARELHDNPLAFINLSIDCGTPETWHKVKGVDNFYHVLDNLKAYRKASKRAGQIILKYIVLPGVNDSEEDFRAFVDIVNLLDVQLIEFSREVLEPRAVGPSNNKIWSFSNTVESAARLLAICKLNGTVPYRFLQYTDYEVSSMNFLADKLLEYMH